MRSLLALIGCAVVAVAAASTPEPLAQDKGASGTWQRLLKLQTTASVMHTTAHPDDEHGGTLAQLSRGRGARVSLLTLTRGESGDNAIGPELFDAVGLIRTEELLMADRYYGVDRQYFTTAVDYGFSKRLEEALVKWGRDDVLREIVRIIRIDRPFVVVARFQGNERDGHGNHQAAGLLTREAFRVAGDPNAFPEQMRDGLRPWQPLKLYMGGVRENEDWTVRIDSNEYSPWLGESYASFARTGLSFQRSQNGGRVTAVPGSSSAYYKRLATAVRLTASTKSPAVEKPDATAVAADAGKETSFFDGIDTTLPGLFTALARAEPPGARGLLTAVDDYVKEAVRSFSMSDPSACVPSLARGLAATRTAIDRLASEPDAVFVLKIKEEQFTDAINAALGIELAAIADVPGPAVRGQRVAVDASLTNHGRSSIEQIEMAIATASDWHSPEVKVNDSALASNATVRHVLSVVVPDDAPYTRPNVVRGSIQESRYSVRDASQMFQPAAGPPVGIVAAYSVAGVRVGIRRAVQRREAHLPFGDELRELTVVPAVAVNVAPKTEIVPVAGAPRTVEVRAEIVNNGGAHSGSLALRLPSGWTSSPERAEFSFDRAGQRSTFAFTLTPSAVAAREYRVEAVATVDGRDYAEGYDVLEHRDLETRYLYHPATIDLRVVDVAIAPNLNVGYVMGIGDEVPAGIAQLGASVTLLGEQDLARGDLSRYDAIVTGTRAYAVRDDLKTYNHRLLDYVKAGGNLIVLYNTQELAPAQFAPFAGVLTARAEEVSEEDSPVDILAPAHRVLNVPNRITRADFDGWVEQRGSKFWSEWDRAYTPIIATHDIGQSWQAGGWLVADYGKGHYTYFAYAFHRQLPYGVPGAYRILANLLSLGRG
ncbi:MAG TPA: PIG-L family deacetylase [Vicinamibacterales bacterium]|nr:PIG-L family deacetylase [Vicinamibacterales bacterium]